MKRFFTVLLLISATLVAVAQQSPLKPRPDAFPSVKETPDTKSIVMATTVEEMTAWDRYPTYPVYVEMMHRWVERYPELCHMDTIGTSLQGRLILSLYIAPSTDDDLYRPEFFYSSTIHGDELTGYIMMLRLIDTLLASYGTSPELTALLNSTRISINPLANPDGTYWGGDNSVMASRRENANGIDLNRNFPNPFAPVAKSIPHENQLMIAYLTAHNFRLSANLHGGSEVMNYPWDSFTLEENPHPYAEWWQVVGRRFVDTARTVDNTRFRDVSQDGVIAGGDWYVISGGRQDYVNYYLDCLEMTMEVSLQKILPCEWLPYYWRLLSKSLINYIGEIHSLPNSIGIEEVEGGKRRVECYPNPTTGIVTVTGIEAGTKIELLDFTGRLLHTYSSHQAIKPSDNQTITLDLSSFVPGLYLLRTSSGTAKLLKR